MWPFLRVIAVLFFIVLLILLLGPGTPVEQGVPGLDKIAHFIAFGGVLWSLGVLFRRQRRIVLAFWALVFGAATEVVQGMVGRDADWFDLLADASGIAVALLIWVCWRRFQPRSARQAATEAVARPENAG